MAANSSALRNDDINKGRINGIKPLIFNRKDLHIHLPEGAVPKDGPSAGVALTTAMVSAITGVPVHADLAMTGEITLRGKVLPVGGLPEKTVAALRFGMKTVLLPAQNEKDLPDLPDTVKKSLNLIFVSTIEEVLEYALVENPAEKKQAKPAASSPSREAGRDRTRPSVS